MRSKPMIGTSAGQRDSHRQPYGQQLLPTTQTAGSSYSIITITVPNHLECTFLDFLTVYCADQPWHIAFAAAETAEWLQGQAELHENGDTNIYRII